MARTDRNGSVSTSTSLRDDLSATDLGHQPGADELVPSWTGWAELENDPLIFSTLLREWGVPNIQVNEVVPLESVFNHPS